MTPEELYRLAQNHLGRYIDREKIHRDPAWVRWMRENHEAVYLDLTVTPAEAIDLRRWFSR